jgi:hypothetical protein
MPTPEYGLLATKRLGDEHVTMTWRSDAKPDPLSGFEGALFRVGAGHGANRHGASDGQGHGREYVVFFTPRPPWRMTRFLAMRRLTVRRTLSTDTPRD